MARTEKHKEQEKPRKLKKSKPPSAKSENPPNPQKKQKNPPLISRPSSTYYFHYPKSGNNGHSKRASTTYGDSSEAQEWRGDKHKSRICHGGEGEIEEEDHGCF